MWAEQPPPAIGHQHEADVVNRNPDVKGKIANQTKTKKSISAFYHKGHGNFCCIDY